MIYDHSHCPIDAHDRDPGTSINDGQAIDEHGQMLCNHCNAPLLYCQTYRTYDHAEPGTPPCWLVHS